VHHAAYTGTGGDPACCGQLHASGMLVCTAGCAKGGPCLCLDVQCEIFLCPDLLLFAVKLVQGLWLTLPCYSVHLRCVLTAFPRAYCLDLCYSCLQALCGAGGVGGLGGVAGSMQHGGWDDLGKYF
jgi:hypothetical protein